MSGRPCFCGNAACIKCEGRSAATTARQHRIPVVKSASATVPAFGKQMDADKAEGMTAPNPYRCERCPLSGDPCVCGKWDERAAVVKHLRAFAAQYPPDVFPSQADGGDTTGNAGAAARHVLSIAASEIEKGTHHD